MVWEAYIQNFVPRVWRLRGFGKTRVHEDQWGCGVHIWAFISGIGPGQSAIMWVALVQGFVSLLDLVSPVKRMIAYSGEKKMVKS